MNGWSLKINNKMYSRKPQRSHWHCNQVFSASNECCTTIRKKQDKKQWVFARYYRNNVSFYINKFFLNVTITKDKNYIGHFYKKKTDVRRALVILHITHIPLVQKSYWNFNLHFLWPLNIFCEYEEISVYIFESSHMFARYTFLVSLSRKRLCPSVHLPGRQ